MQLSDAIKASKESAKQVLSDKSYYLSSVFSMYSPDKEQEKVWLITFYNSTDNKLETFSENKHQSSEDIFSKDEKVKELIMAEVKIDEKTALNSAINILNEKYKEKFIQKQVLVLQKIKDQLLWNITFITDTFKVVNIKISATQGNEISSKLTNISEFMQNKT